MLVPLAVDMLVSSQLQIGENMEEQGRGKQLIELEQILTLGISPSVGSL